MNYSNSGAKVRYVEEDEDSSGDEGILLPSSCSMTPSTPSVNIPMPFNLTHCPVSSFRFIALLSLKPTSVVYQTKVDEKDKVLKLVSVAGLKEENIDNYIEKCKKAKNSVLSELSVSYIKEDYLLFITMPYYRCGSLEHVKFDLLLGNNEDIYNILNQICEGIKYLNEINEIHNNIKPSNILLENERRIYLSDGNKNVLYKDSIYYPSIDTIKYLSPENLKNEEMSNKSDIWSIGCIMLYIYSGGCNPFNNESYNILINSIINGNHIRLKGKNNEQLNDIIDHLININPKNRYNINDLIEKLKSTIRYLPVYIPECPSIKSEDKVIRRKQKFNSTISETLSQSLNISDTINTTNDLTIDQVKSLLDSNIDENTVNIIISNRRIVGQLVREYNRKTEDKLFYLFVKIAYLVPNMKSKLLSDFKLDLSNNQFHSKLFKCLNEEKGFSLIWANLSSSDLKNLCDHFYMFPSLIKLDLSYNDIDDEALSYLKVHLDYLPNLSSLNLKRNKKITDKSIIDEIKSSYPSIEIQSDLL